jgi:signal transduction histidine kinase
MVGGMPLASKRCPARHSGTKPARRQITQVILALGVCQSRIDKSMSRRAQYWGCCLVGLVFVQGAASLLLPKRGFALTATSDLIQCALLLCATLSCLPGVINTTGRVRLFWALMGFGLSNWLAYQLLWTYIEVFQRREVPDPFAGDVIVFLHFVPMMAALALLPNVQQDEREHRLGSLDFALLLLWWIYLYVYTVIPWQYVELNEASYSHNLNSAYLAEKMAFLVGVAILWYRSSGLWKSIYAHWFGASLLYSSSSYVANWAINHNSYYSGSLYDLPMVASMAWMSVPGLLALRPSPQQTDSKKALPRGVWAARLGMVAVFSLPIFAWLAFFNRQIPAPVRDFRLLLTLAAIVLMGVLVFLKQHFLDIELIRSLRSSRQSFQDLQLLQAQLIQSEKLASLGHLVGGAAHELNNPLTAMLGYSELLSGTELSNEQRALSDKISQQAKRIRSLVASLLSFAKQAPASKSSVDVNLVVQTALKLCRPQLQSANAQYTADLEEPIPNVRGDSNQLLKVFIQIITNAAHALSEKREGVLRVSSRCADGVVRVEFADNGPGISQPDRVFDPFYTTRPVGQGTGLGLSMCYGIIQEHGGKITCHNREEGGATFVVEMPIVQSLEESKAQAHAVKL